MLQWREEPSNPRSASPVDISGAKQVLTVTPLNSHTVSRSRTKVLLRWYSWLEGVVRRPLSIRDAYVRSGLRILNSE